MHKIILLLILAFISTIHAKTVILGFDGMDPKLAQQWMDSGDLPNFKKLATQGSFQPLATTNPAQSPVAWSSFATGLNPGEHGIFDFIHRDPQNFKPVYSISGYKQPDTIDLFGWKIPSSEPSLYNKRIGKPFWLTAEQKGNSSSILRVPVTYPPDNTTTMLSGMGVPDLLGTQGTYTFYATKYIDKGKNGGNIERIKVKNDKVETKLLGPPNPFGGQILSVPLTLKKLNSNSLEFNLNGKINQIKTGDWSDWIPVDFSYAGVFSLNGMVRIYLQESFPRVKLYISPININPQDPALPISNPPDFSKQLSDEIGLFHTLGMPEETWSLNDGLIDSETYLQMVKTILAEREKMFFRQLDDDDIDLLVEVFVQTDRVSHMFWRGFDSKHPSYDNTNEIERSAIKWIYQEADRILGKTLDKLNPDDKLIVLSDHGFAPYYRHVNLNRWLQQNGYLNLKASTNVEHFNLDDVDWSTTKAYAMGLNGIYFNLLGREKHGFIKARETAALSEELRAKLQNLNDQDQPVINHVYKRSEIYSGNQSPNSPDLIVGYKRGFRASWQTVLGEAPKELFSTNTDNWSGDHCIDPQLVPGVLFTNFKHSSNTTNISDIGEFALSTLNNKPINTAKIKKIALLDLPRTLVEFIIYPLHKYLPASITMILSGLILALFLWGIKSVTHRMPNKFKLRSLLKLLLMSVSVLLFFIVSKDKFSNDNIETGDEIIVSAIPISTVELPELLWSDNMEIVKKGHNVWQIKPQNNIAKLQESDGYTLISLDNSLPIYSTTQKQWWHSLLSNKGGYISPHSQVSEIQIQNIQKRSYWWIWVLLGFLIGTVLLSYIRKKL